MTFNPFKRHIMDLQPCEEKHAIDILTKFKLKNPQRFVYPDYDSKQKKEIVTKSREQIQKELWFKRVCSHNALYTHKMKVIYNDTKHPFLTRVKYLEYMYESVSRKLNYYEELAYSYHYMLQLHIQFMFDSVDSDSDSCLTHNSISEYKDIDMEINECFCASLFNKPQFCLYCRNPKYYNSNHLVVEPLTDKLDKLTI